MGRHIIQREGSADTASTSQTETDMYDLYGVTNHYGNINGGHYTGKQVEKTCLNFNPHLRNGLSHPYQLDESTLISRGNRSSFLSLYQFSMMVL